MQPRALRAGEIEPGTGGDNSEGGKCVAAVAGGEGVMNIQHPTSNIQHPGPGGQSAAHWMLDVGCWMLDVRLFLLIALFLGSVSPGFAADVSSDFDAANNLYAQGRFTDAAAAYEKLLQAGQVSPAIYFNL